MLCRCKCADAHVHAYAYAFRWPDRRTLHFGCLNKSLIYGKKSHWIAFRLVWCGFLSWQFVFIVWARDAWLYAVYLCRTCSFRNAHKLSLDLSCCSELSRYMLARLWAAKHPLCLCRRITNTSIDWHRGLLLVFLRKNDLDWHYSFAARSYAFWKISRAPLYETFRKKALIALLSRRNRQI